MSLKFFSIALVLLIPLLSVSQDEYFSSLTIPSTLTDHANAVIRKNDVVVSLNSPSEMVVEVHRIITVLNQEGNKHVDAYAHYDNSIKIKSINIDKLNSILKSLNVQNVLKRGFVLLKNNKGKIIKNSKSLKKEKNFKIKLYDDELEAQLKKI